MLDLVLYGPQGPQPLGGSAPVRAKVRNSGERAVWIAGVLDGSEDGIRFPHYLPAVTLADGGRTVARPGPAEDPLVGPLRVGHLLRLAPGESFDPTAGAGCLPLTTFAAFAPKPPAATGTRSPSPPRRGVPRSGWAVSVCRPGPSGRNCWT
ncbi:hypothetical protein SAV31267_086110 [Streptomyces avermitilis]|uniref:Uncharacterized protein n=1 Tax=Streptomyces avermitilis TaxID=33903 RepID=A0A4D4N5D8_STRAX|nr:hypothetical protein [Streptomyces avermitilis]GDY79126.1 hypothetical protein SAV31267_086110 [Streptomyces avermitilis]